MFYWSLFISLSIITPTYCVETLYLTIFYIVRQVILIGINYILLPSLYSRKKWRWWDCHEIFIWQLWPWPFSLARIPWNSFKSPQVSLAFIFSTAEYWRMINLCSVQIMNHAYVAGLRGEGHFWVALCTRCLDHLENESVEQVLV